MSVSSPAADSPDVDCGTQQPCLPSSTALSIDERLEIFLEANLVASLIDINEVSDCESAGVTAGPENLLLDSLSGSMDCASSGGGGVSRAIGKQRRRGTYDLACTDGTGTSPLPQPPSSWLLDEPAQDLNRTFCLVASSGDGALAAPSSANVSPLILGDEFQRPARQSASSRSSYATAKSSLSPLNRLAEAGENDDDEASSDAATVSYSPPLPPPPPQFLADESDSLMAEADEADCTLVPQSLTKIPPSPLTLPSRIDGSQLSKPSEYREIPHQSMPVSKSTLKTIDQDSEVLHLSSENAVCKSATRLQESKSQLQYSSLSPPMECQSLIADNKSVHIESHSQDSESHEFKPDIESQDSESHEFKPDIESQDSESHEFKPDIESQDSESQEFKLDIESQDSESHEFKPDVESQDSESHEFKPDIESQDSESHHFKSDIQSQDSESHELKSELQSHSSESPLLESETQPENSFPLHPVASLARRVGSLCPPKSASSLPLQSVSQTQRLTVGGTGLPKSRFSCLQPPQQLSASLPAPQHSRLRAPLAGPSQASGLRAPASLLLQPIRTAGSRLPGPANSAPASAGTFGAARASGLRRPTAMPPPR